MAKESNTEKIRALLTQNPDATCEDLEEIFGTVTRSLKVQFWKEYKKMFGKTYRSDHLKYEDVIAYFQEHPGKSITDARRELPYTRQQIHAALQRARTKEISVPCRKEYHPEQLNSDADKIRQYALQHPTATCKECAEALHVGYSNANNVLISLRKQNLIPSSTHRGRDRIPEAVIKHCMDLLDAGYSIYRVSQMTGISQTTIKRYKNNQQKKPIDTDMYEDGTCGV